MIRFFFPVLVFCFSVASVAQNKIDVLHYKFSLELNDNNDTIYGNASIQIKFNTTTSYLKLDLVNINETGKGMIVDSITGPGIRGFAKNRDSIRIFFISNARILPGDTFTYNIKYHGIPAGGFIISKNKYGHRTFFSDNWPNLAHHWIPCVDNPADKASVEFIVTAPSHYQVVSNGIQIEETNLPGQKKLTHYKEDVPLPTKVMVIGAADFAVSRAGEINCVPVYSWVFPENKKEGFYDYAQATDILAYFINYIGPYPYKKLANVQSKTIFGGMENAGAIFYSESSVTGNREEESLLAHEIAHQWFGDMVTEKSFAHLWLSEGFATYFAHLYDEAKNGAENFTNSMKAEREEVVDFVRTSGKPVVDSISSYMQLLNPNSYQKGSWVLHMLRRQLGDSVFKKSIRKYYDIYAGKNADTRDLQKVFESVSGKNLETFFTQWLYKASNLLLDIRWKYNKAEKNIAVTVKQLQTSGDFQFPLEILVQESMNSIPKKMTRAISKNTETFLFPVQAKPVRFEADPMVSLLFEGTVKEIK